MIPKEQLFLKYEESRLRVLSNNMPDPTIDSSKFDYWIGEIRYRIDQIDNLRMKISK